MIEIRGSRAIGNRQALIHGRWVELSQLETAQRQSPLIEDAVIVVREAEAGTIELVVYVVPALPYVAERLEAQVQSAMPSEISCRCVPVANIPLTADGEVDEQALGQLPILDDELIGRWEVKLRQLPPIRQAGVVVQELTTDEKRLHLTDLIAGWKPSVLQDAEAGAAASQSAEGTAKELKPRPPAYANGGPLAIPADAPKTFTEAILRTAKKFPRKGILHVRANGEELFQSYPALLEQAKRILAGLQAKGLKPGDRVVLQCERLADHFASFWACVLGGITPVNVAVAPSYAERNSIVNKLYNIWKLLQHPVVVASEHLVKPLTELERFFPGEGFHVLSVEGLKKNEPTENIHPAKPDDLVFFQLTSGSTGVPKCIQESHRSIIAHIHGSAQFNGYSSDDVILNWLPVDHVVPTLTCNLKDVYMGCQEVQVETNVVIAEPLRWLDLMETHKVTHSWAPNFGFKLVADRLASVEDKKWDLSQVKFLMNAGEQVTLPVVSEFLKRTAPFGIVPRMMQPSFGMAEACTCMTYTNDYSEKISVHRFLKSTLSGLLQPSAAQDASTITFIDLGPPVPGVEIRITDSQNKVVPEGKIGRFQIKGDVITRGYLYNDAANQEAFVGDGWFNSGDLGYIWNGRLALTGREKEMIIIRGANFYCYEIEDVVNTLPGTQPTFTAAVAVSDPATGTESLAIFFVPQRDDIEEKVRLIEQIRKAVASNLGISPSMIVPLPKAEFCKTTSGKIQRNQMKKSLAAGQYDPILKEIDLALGNANTLPSWFYQVGWRRKQIAAQALQGLDGATLVFLDSKGLGAEVCSKLGGKSACVRVEPATDFAKLTHESYRINAADASHYSRLLKSIADDGIKVGRVLHLLTYGEYAGDWATSDIQPSLERGVLSLLFLAKALHGLPEGQRPSRLIVGSSHSQHAQEEVAVDSTRSMVLGLLKTIPQEMPWLASTHVDLPGRNVAAEVDAFSAELPAAGADREAAWRDGARWVPVLQPVDFAQAPKRAESFKKNSLYVLTGGLGGIGVELAKYLLKNHQVRLLILGRTALPDRSTWSDLSQTAHQDHVAERIHALRELENLGDVAYEAVDICDAAALQAAVKRAGARWKSDVEGVIHLAGLYRESAIADEGRESLTAVLQSKVMGTLALHQLIKDRPGALFLTFASVNGFFGGFSVGAYAAANAFQESFAHWQRNASIHSQCLAWSLWDETGMSRGFAMKQLARARGYYSISREQGLHSFRAASQLEYPHMLIGLDASKAAIRRHLEEARPALQQLSAYFVPRDGAQPANDLQKLAVADRYQTMTACRFHRLESMPLTQTGEIDRQKLAAHVLDGEVGSEPLQTELEKALAGVWTEVLGIEKVGRNDNFFDLGGHSLSAVQITFKIQQTFQVNLPLKTFLEAPVLSAQAEQLEKELLAQADADEVEVIVKAMGAG